MLIRGYHPGVDQKVHPVLIRGYTQGIPVLIRGYHQGYLRVLFRGLPPGIPTGVIQRVTHQDIPGRSTEGYPPRCTREEY